MKKPTTTAFAEAAGISPGYASDILNGNRPMPRALAIHMFREIGWRHESIAELTETQIAVLTEIEFWEKRKKRAAA